MPGKHVEPNQRTIDARSPKPRGKPRVSQLEPKNAKHPPPFPQARLADNRPTVTPPPGQQRHDQGQQDHQGNNRNNQISAAPRRLRRHAPHRTPPPRKTHTALARNHARIATNNQSPCHKHRRKENHERQSALAFTATLKNRLPSDSIARLRPNQFLYTANAPIFSFEEVQRDKNE
jgi:hypothetical protein